MADSVVIAAPRLKQAIAAIVAAGGSDAVEAGRVADNLVEANLRGHDSHGAGMIALYVTALKGGGLRANRHAKTLSDIGTILRIDGDRGYGQVIGHEAMAMGIERARELGTCIVGISDSHHLGRIGHWAEQCAAAGLVSIHFVNVLSRPIVAPWGGRSPVTSTNPICIGVPRAGKAPFLLDFATARVASGKVRVAYNKGEPLPPGNLIDAAGQPTTDPRHGIVPPLGAILPFGEHKGSGLSIACELLAGALTGGKTWRGPGQVVTQVVNNMLSIIIDPARMAGEDWLGNESEALIDWVLGSPPAPGVDRVRIAGQPEQETRARRLAEGIPVDVTSWAEIVDAGKRAGMDPAEVQKLAGLG